MGWDMADQTMTVQDSRLPVVFILLTVMIEAIGIGLILPVMPALMQEVQGVDLSHAALWGGFLASIYALMQFLFSPTIGNLSDRFGRRPVLLTSLVVLCIDYIVMAVAQSVWLLLLGRIVGGITAATNSTASAYMADISKPEEKSANFGLIGAAFGMGFVIGPMLGGMLAGFGTRAPFYAAAALAAANALFGYLVLEETVTDAIRRKFEWRRANPLGALRALGSVPGLKPLLFIYFLYQVAFSSYSSVWAIYTGTRFGWSEQMIGLSLGIFGISFAIVSAVLIRPALKYLGERGCVLYGHIGDIAVFLMIAFLNSGKWLLIMTPLAALPGVITPALQGIMSKAVGDDQQGELQGALTSVTAIAMIPAPMMMTSVFAMFSRPDAPIYVPGAPFILGSILMAVALTVFLRTTLPERAAT